LKEPALKRHVPLLLIVLTALALTPLVAWPDPADEELAANKAKLEVARKHPEQLARMRQNLQAFLSLPKARRDELSRLDHELQKEGFAAQLWTVLERYTLWFNQLPPKERQFLRELQEPESRLKVIKDKRFEQWLERQPRAVQQQFQDLQNKADERDRLVAKIQQEERNRRKEWQRVSRFWEELASGKPMPVRLEDLDPEARMGVSEYLMPMLDKDEKQRLKDATGSWPDYMLTVLELAEAHPLALYTTKEGPTQYKQLPRDVQDFLDPPGKTKPRVIAPGLLNQLQHGERKWPGLAVAIVEQLKNGGQQLPHELWAYDLKCLEPPTREFVQKALMPILADPDKDKLLLDSGTWPGYAWRIQDLAEKYDLRAPWRIALFGNPETWDKYRLLQQGSRPRIRYVGWDKMPLDDKPRAQLPFNQAGLLEPFKVFGLEEPLQKHMQDRIDMKNRKKGYQRPAWMDK
jgi:hypothetical protein